MTPSTQVVTIDDFVGAWSGVIHYQMSGGESGSDTVTIVLTNSNGTVAGTYSDSDGSVNINGSVSNGILNFELPRKDADDPDCGMWDVSVSCTLNSSRTAMEMVPSGIFCANKTMANVDGQLIKQ